MVVESRAVSVGVGPIAMAAGGPSLLAMSWVFVMPVPAALTDTLAMPIIALGPALMVSIDVPPADVADAGLSAAVSPVGAVAVMATFSALPETLVSVTVTVAMPPC